MWKRRVTKVCIPDVPEHFGHELYFWRLRNNLTQREAAKLLDVTPSAISSWERGTRDPFFIEELAAVMRAHDTKVLRGVFNMMAGLAHAH